MVFLDLGPATTGVSILAEVKECPVPHLTIAQYAVQDLELGHALAPDMLFDPSKLGILKRGSGLVALLRYPAVALADQTDEENGYARPAAVDLLKADGQGFSTAALLLGDAPAQVHIDEFHLPLPTSAAQFWEHLPDQQVSFLHEVSEGGADEDANVPECGRFYR